MDKLELVLNGAELYHGVSGVNVYLRLLTEALRAPPDTLNWRLAVPRPFAHLADFLPAEKLLVVEGRDVGGYSARALYWNHRIAATVRQHHPEAVFHSVFHFWAPLAPRKCIVTIHDCIELIEPSVRPQNIPTRLHRWLSRSMSRRAQMVIAISEWTKQQAIRHYRIAPEKISVLYNWVRPACQAPVSLTTIAAMRQRYNLPAHYIAYVGGYRAYKNVEFLIAAWNLAKQSQTMPPLALAGSIPKDTNHGFFCDVHGAIAQANASTTEILLPGLISDVDLPAFYAGADLFVSPSRQEGFGYPAVEAIACNRPILVSDASAYPELIPEKDLRFNLATPTVLAKQMRAVLAEPNKYRRPLDTRFTAAYGKIRYEQIIRRLSAESSRSVLPA